MIARRSILTHRRGARQGRIARAFTLVEVIATMTVLSILSVIAFRLISEGIRQYSDTTVRAQLHDRVSTAMERICNELRQIQTISGSSPLSPDIASSFSATQINWNTGQASPRTLTYTSGTSTLALSGAAASSMTLLNNCSACTLIYYDNDNNVVSPGGTVSTIRRIGITLSATQNGVTETLRSKVYIRSMMVGSGAS